MNRPSHVCTHGCVISVTNACDRVAVCCSTSKANEHIKHVKVKIVVRRVHS
jgi:hypothetical protein